MTSTAAAISPDELNELDALLDDLRTREEETPSWEFCEGFLAALICCRRSIPAREYFPVLLGSGSDDATDDTGLAQVFKDGEQLERFMTLWLKRWNQVAQQLSAPVESLVDENAYAPELMDLRAALDRLSEDERAAVAQAADGSVPAFAQVWALGFMCAVENWPQEWVPPRDKEAAQWVNESLEAIMTLTEDDTEPPTINVQEDDGPPSVSEQRLEQFGDALWAVYNLHDVWAEVGPRIETVHKEPTPGRNDVCHCGSGKKYKKCCGSN